MPSRERVHIPALQKENHDSKMPAGKGYVSSQEGRYHIHHTGTFSWSTPPEINIAPENRAQTEITSFDPSHSDACLPEGNYDLPNSPWIYHNSGQIIMFHQPI